MPEYLIVDGPFDGEVVGANEPYDAGDVVEVEVFDAGQSEAERLTFEVQRPAQFHRQGLLRPAEVN